MDFNLSRKQNVLTLSHQALHTLGSTIVQGLLFANKNRCDDCFSYSKQIAAQKIKEYLNNSNATSRVYQDLFTKIIECHISMEVFLLAMEAIFNESIKSIETKQFLFRSLEANSTFWDILLKHPGGFQKLKFDYVNRHKSELAKIFEKSPNLKELEMDGRNLTSISSFPQTLTKIRIFGLKPNEVADILLSCPNIESLCSCPLVGESLMICLEKNKNFRSKLKYVWQYKSNKKIFEVIVLTCPQMNSLRLDIIEDDSLFVLEQTFLSELEIYRWDDGVMAWLAKIGCNLRHFFLRQQYNDYEIDLGKLYQYCPSLRTLELEASRIYISHKFASFDYLNKFQMLCDEISISKLDFIALLSNLKSLESFEVSEVPLDDGDIQSIFGARDFVNLTTFIVYRSDKLTAQSVHVLLECCPKLEFIGDLTEWNISKNEIDLNFKCLKDVDDCVFDNVLDTRGFEKSFLYDELEFGSESEDY